MIRFDYAQRSHQHAYAGCEDIDMKHTRSKCSFFPDSFPKYVYSSWQLATSARMPVMSGVTSPL